MHNKNIALNRPQNGQNSRDFLCQKISDWRSTTADLWPSKKVMKLLDEADWATPDEVIHCMRGWLVSALRLGDAAKDVWPAYAELKGMSWPYFESCMAEAGVPANYFSSIRTSVVASLIWKSYYSDTPPNVKMFPDQNSIITDSFSVFTHLLTGDSAEFAATVWKKFDSLPGMTWQVFESMLRAAGHQEDMIRTAKRLSRKREPLNSTFRLRSGHDPAKAKLAREAVVTWTTSQYQLTQDFLRQGDNRDGASEHAASMGSYFKRMVATAPHGAKRGTPYLYRGVHAVMANALQKHGFLHDQGYLAFSWDKSIATAFAHNELILRLRVREVPAGTPWIWFGTGAHPASTLAKEAEVLLPPGRLLVSQKDPEEPDVLPVKYLPFK